MKNMESIKKTLTELGKSGYKSLVFFEMDNTKKYLLVSSHYHKFKILKSGLAINPWGDDDELYYETKDIDDATKYIYNIKEKHYVNGITLVQYDGNAVRDTLRNHYNRIK